MRLSDMSRFSASLTLIGTMLIMIVNMQELDIRTRLKFLIQISIAMCLYALLIYFTTKDHGGEFSIVYTDEKKNILKRYTDASKLPSTLL